MPRIYKNIKVENNIKYEDEILIEALSDAKGTDIIDIREGTQVVNSAAFKNAHILKVNFPESISLIREEAFLGCTYLSKVIIPGYCAFQSFAFADNECLDEINIKTRAIPFSCFRNAGIHSEEGVSVFLENTEVLCERAFLCAKIKDIEFPDTIKKIEGNAFRGVDFKEGTILKIPEGTEYFGNYVFYKATGLADVYLPNSLKYIGTLDRDITYHVSQKIYDLYDLKFKTMYKLVIEEEPTIDKLLDTMTFKQANNRQLELSKTNETDAIIIKGINK